MFEPWSAIMSARRYPSARPVPPLADTYLTTIEVSTLFKVKESWIYDRTQALAIPHIRMGRLLRFEPDALARWVDAQRVWPRG